MSKSEKEELVTPDTQDADTESETLHQPPEDRHVIRIIKDKPFSEKQHEFLIVP